MKQTETETKRVVVDFAHLAELERMECVTRVIKEPRIEVETRRRLPWVQPERKPKEFGRVFAGKRLIPEEGGER